MAFNIIEIKPIDTVDDILADFKNTGIYTDEFLIDLEDGLRKSSYAKN